MVNQWYTNGLLHTTNGIPNTTLGIPFYLKPVAVNQWYTNGYTNGIPMVYHNVPTVYHWYTKTWIWKKSANIWDVRRFFSCLQTFGTPKHYQAVPKLYQTLPIGETQPKSVWDCTKQYQCGIPLVQYGIPIGTQKKHTFFFIGEFLFRRKYRGTGSLSQRWLKKELGRRLINGGQGEGGWI